MYQKSLFDKLLYKANIRLIIVINYELIAFLVLPGNFKLKLTFVTYTSSFFNTYLFDK